MARPAGTGRTVADLHRCRATCRTVALGREIGGEGLPTGTDTAQGTGGEIGTGREVAHLLRG